MTTYRIINTQSGLDMGCVEANDESEALDIMAREAGYRDHAHACEQADCEGMEAREAHPIATDKHAPPAIEAVFALRYYLKPSDYDRPCFGGEDVEGRIKALRGALGVSQVTDEDTVVYDPADGLIALYVVGAGYAWEEA